jgi:hypothetical protein
MKNKQENWWNCYKFCAHSFARFKFGGLNATKMKATKMMLETNILLG